VLLLGLGLAAAWATGSIGRKGPDATLVIEGLPPEARVFLDDRETPVDRPGDGRPAELAVTPGRHEVEVRGGGGRAFREAVDVKARDEARVVVRLDPEGSPEPGFVPLFNGKDTAGWKAGPGQVNTWKVDDGVLFGAGRWPSFLYSERGDYRDFHLRVEARINAVGNSGVFGRAGFGVTPPREHPGCPEWFEAQICSAPGDTAPTGTLLASNGRPSAFEPTFRVPAHEWFTMEMVAEGNLVTVKVNGRVTGLIRTNPACVRPGHIALQHYVPRSLVEFRKVEIRELPAR
jgi:hypothetical protein